MSKAWIKLYTEALHDRKMRKLNRVDKSIFYDLLLLAGQEDASGILPDIEDIALELDLKVTEATEAVTRLIKAGVISKNDNGDLYVTNYIKRQDSNLTGAEKTKRYRERLQKGDECDFNVTEQGHTCDLNVTEEGHNSDQTVTEQGHTCNEKVTVEEELRIKKKEEDKELIKLHCADAQKSERTGPDDLSFWQKTFGPRAGMAHAFHLASGITPVKSEFGRWQNDLKDLNEAGITIPLLQAAVSQMKAENLTIKAPGSVLAIARKIAANGGRTGRPQVQGKRTYSAADVLAMEQAGQL